MQAPRKFFQVPAIQYVYHLNLVYKVHTYDVYKYIYMYMYMYM